jgi:large repetitive protein
VKKVLIAVVVASLVAAGTYFLLPPAGKATIAPLYLLSGHTPVDEFGHSVAALGDVNGDGYDDVLIGAPNENLRFANAGTARVYSGVNGSALMTFAGDGDGWHQGSGVGVAGDVDADGVVDIVVGMKASGKTGLGPGGGARVFSGRTGKVLNFFSGTNLDDKFGLAVAGAGDVNADGHADIVVGAPGEYTKNISGYARVFSGADGTLLYTFKSVKPQLGDRFGFAVDGAGDVDGDGFADVLVGALGDDDHGSHAGAAYLFSGADGHLIRRFLGDKSLDELGHSVSPVADLDGDGRPEQFVGAFSYSGVGYARVYSSRDGHILREFHGEMISDAFGHSVAGVGDVDGDGVADLLVGAADARLDPDDDPWNRPRDQSPPAPGYAKVYSGADGSLIATWWGNHDIHLGYSVSAAGDVNADGFADMILGATVFDDVGQVWLVSACSVTGAQAPAAEGFALGPRLNWLPAKRTDGRQIPGQLQAVGFTPGSSAVLEVCKKSAQLPCTDQDVLYSIPFSVPLAGGPATIPFNPMHNKFAGQWVQLVTKSDNRVIVTNSVQALLCH